MTLQSTASAFRPSTAPGLDPLGGLLVFAASLLVAGFAIHVATNRVVFSDEPVNWTYGYAVLTALLGALAWGLLSWIPVLGAIVALIAWIAVIRWRYPGGWVRSAIVGVVAWGAAVIVVAALELVGFGAVSALGVPGT